MTKTSSLSIAGFFAGVGGIELGFQQAGFEPTFANELDQKASVTYKKNHDHELMVGDIADVTEESFGSKPTVIAGGFPCQAFSIAGYRKGFEDPRGNVYWHIHRLIDKMSPEVIFLENVKNLQSHDNGNTFKVICESLEDLGYKLKYKVLNASEYGNIPQNRERIYIVGFKSKHAFDHFHFPEKKRLTTRLDQLINFDSEVPEKYYYGPEKAMYREIKDEITSRETVYQWRRHYVRENKSGVCPTLTANMGTGGHNVPLILSKRGIRKLTPRECFNIMGFPKSFKLPSELSDASLYKQAGNSVVVPVIKRIAENIAVALKA
jgi:DNA (cytosine-5)-methyltransferase 1